MDVPTGPIGLAYLAFFGLLIPWAAVRTARRLAARPLPPRAHYYRAVIAQQAAFLLLSAWVARREGVSVWPASWPPAWSWPLAALLAAALVALTRPLWRADVARGERRSYLMMPANRAERLLWVGVSVCAGVGEEVTYRGVLFALLWRVTGSPIAASAASAVIFGVSHFLQGWRSMAIITALALLFQGIAWATGSLLIGMVIHVVFDVCAGLHYARYGRALRYVPREHLPPPNPAGA